MLMISKWNDVIYLIWIDVVVEKCHFSCFSNLDFCSWWGYYKRFYGIVVSWKYALVNIIYDKYIFVGFFFLCICMVCCNGVIVYWQYVYVCVMNGWNGCFYLFIVVCISSLIMLFKQDDKYIYKYKWKKCQERRRGEIILQIPFGFLHRLYRVFCTSILISCT